MGNVQGNSKNSLSDWEKVDTENGVEIYRNKKNNQLAEKRIITLEPEHDIQKQINIYHIRQHNNDALVRTLATQNLDSDSKSSGLCSEHKKIFVFTQKMPYRLSECPQLTFPQSLLFLKEALRGYQRIYKDYGPVQVTKDMIGINYLGEVKSWLHENWALNHRGHEYMNIRSAKVSQLSREQYLAFRGQYLEESQMIKNIILVIEQKCEDGRFPLAFKQEVYNQSGSFKKLLLYLKDFIEYNQIYVPEKINYEELLKNNYRVRLEYQLGLNGTLRNAQPQPNNNPNSLVPDRLLEQIGSEQSNPFLTKPSIPFAQNQTYQPNAPILTQGPLISGKKPFIPEPKISSPAMSQNLGPVTFSQTARTYNNIQSNISKITKPLEQTRLGSQSINDKKWTNNLDGLYNPNYQSSSLINGTNSLPGDKSGNSSQNMNNKPVNAQSKYQFSGLFSYTPYQPKLDQPISFRAGFEPYFPRLNEKNTDSNNGSQGSNYTYTYSNTYNPSANQSSVGNSFNTPKSALMSSFNYNLSSGYQPSFTPITTELNSPINEPSSIRNYEKRQITIDAKTGQKLTIMNQDFLGVSSLESKQIHQSPSPLGYKDASGTNNWVSTSQTTQTKNLPFQLPPQPPRTSVTQITQVLTFGAKQDPSFIVENPYTGIGYSNTLAKYEKGSNEGFKIEGKYANEFNKIITGQVSQQTVSSVIHGEGQASEQMIDTKNMEVVPGPKIQQKPQLSTSKPILENHFQGSQQGERVLVPKTFEGFKNIVQRTSSEVNQTVLRQF